METVIYVALQGAFFLVFAAVVLRYARHRTSLNRDLVALFASVAGLFLLGILSRLIPGPDPITPLSGVLLMAQPFLALRLVGHFAPLPPWLAVGALAGFVSTSALFIAGATEDRLAILYIVAYFVIANTIAAMRLLAAARLRVGTARARLLLAATATFLFGAAILVAGAGSAASAPGDDAPTSVSTLARLVALLAGLGYLLAFMPPRWFRRVQQQAIAFELNQELLSLPAGTEPAEMWRRLAAAARQVTGGRASAIVSSGPDAELVAVDGTWRDEPAVGTSLGRRPDVAVVTQPRVLSDPPEPLAALARAAEAGTTIAVPLSAGVGERGVLLVFVSGSLLFVDDDLALLSVLASRTISSIEREEALADRSALVTTLRRTNEELARASAAKSDFLAAMSHELRTPLNSIIGFSELLMAPISSESPRRGLDTVDQAGHIHAAGLQLLDLINEVLDLARVEAGRLDLHYERFDLGSLVRRTIDSMMPLADRRSLAVTLDVQADFDIEADPARIRQIVYNLLSNAIKFSPESGTVRVTVAADGDDGLVAVADEGPGIPADEHATVFEAFAQGIQGRRQSGGTGLGLALSRQLADAHAGSIELLSVPPGGSTFTLRLPLQRAASALAQPDRDGRRLVLVIEDDPGSVALLRSWLEPEGYAIAVADSGERGLELARTLAPDAILLDILLPGLDGWDVLQQLRIERRTRRVPILVVSVVDDQQLGLALGAADYFVKPVDRDALLDRLGWVTRTRLSPDPPVVVAIDADEAAQQSYRLAFDGAARLVEARSGAEGRSLSIDAGPDAILLDLSIADMSPFDLLAALKAHPATRTCPIFALTAHPLTDQEKRRLSGQVVAILEKRDAPAGLITWLTSLPEREAYASTPTP